MRHLHKKSNTTRTIKIIELGRNGDSPSDTKKRASRYLYKDGSSLTETKGAITDESDEVERNRSRSYRR